MKTCKLIIALLIVLHCLVATHVIKAQDSLKTKVSINASGESVEIFALKSDTIDTHLVDSKIRSAVSTIQSEIGTLESKLQFKLDSFLRGKANDDDELYDRNYKETLNSVQLAYAAKLLNTDILQDISQSGAYNILIRINNPESNELGFQFSDVISKQIEDQLVGMEDLKKDDKTIFKIGFKKLIGGISKLLTPTSLVGSAIQFISSFVPAKVKDAISDPIGEKFIDDFKSGIDNYIIYYRTLDTYNGLFEQDLRNLVIKYSTIEHRLEAYIDQNVEPLNLNENQPLADEVNLYFNFGNQKTSLNKQLLNNDENIIRMSNNVSELRSIVRLLTEFVSDYDRIVSSNFNRNLDLLKTASSLPDIKKGNIDNLIIELESRKKGGILPNQQVVAQGFENKFDDNINAVLVFARALN